MDLMRQRVADFPPELDEYYRYMFQHLDHTYRKQTAHALTMAIAWSYQHPLSFMLFWLNERETMCADSPHQHKRVLLSDEEFYVMAKETQTFLDTRCRDFLHMPDLNVHTKSQAWNCRVEFLHRTVVDFFNTAEMKRVLEESLEAPFTSLEYLDHLILARTQFVPIDHTHGDYLEHILTLAICSPASRSIGTAITLERAALCDLEERGRYETDYMPLPVTHNWIVTAYSLSHGLRSYFDEHIKARPESNSLGLGDMLIAPVLGFFLFKSFSIADVDMDVVLTLFEHNLDVTKVWPTVAYALAKEYRPDHPKKAKLLDNATTFVKLILANDLVRMDCVNCEQSPRRPQDDVKASRHKADDGLTCVRDILEELVPEALDKELSAELRDRCVVGRRLPRDEPDDSCTEGIVGNDSDASLEAPPCHERLRTPTLSRS